MAGPKQEEVSWPQSKQQLFHLFQVVDSTVILPLMYKSLQTIHCLMPHPWFLSLPLWGFYLDPLTWGFIDVLSLKSDSRRRPCSPLPRPSTLHWLLNTLSSQMSSQVQLRSRRLRDKQSSTTLLPAPPTPSSSSSSRSWRLSALHTYTFIHKHRTKALGSTLWMLTPCTSTYTRQRQILPGLFIFTLSKDNFVYDYVSILVYKKMSSSQPRSTSQMRSPTTTHLSSSRPRTSSASSPSLPR